MTVLGIGDCTLEHFGVVDRFVDPSMKVEMSKFSVQGGGPAANSTVVLARWGADAAFAGKVGDDLRGEQIEATLSEEGVDTSRLTKQSEAVSQFSFTTLQEKSGRKKTLYTRGSVSPIRADEVDPDWFDETSLLLVDGRQTDAQRRAMQIADERGVEVLLDVNDVPPEAGDIVKNATYLVVSERFASRYTGVGELESLCEHLLEEGPETVAVTLGNEGVVAAERGGDGLVRVGSHPVDEVDTTGSGDVFAGAFAYGIQEGWSLRRRIETANVAAGLSCTGIGARGAIPELSEVDAHL